MQYEFDFYQTAIHQTIPNICRTWAPTVRGAKNNVIFAETVKGAQYAFKFSGCDSAVRNAQISRVLASADIPVPDVAPVHCGGQWFEMYHILPGLTLHEYVGRGATKTEIQSVYHQVLDYFAKMSHIDFSGIYFGNLKYAHQAAYRDTTTTNGSIIGSLTAAAVRMMNIGSESNQGLYHHGLTPKNILVSNRGEVTGLLDIDEIGICNKNYAFGVMAAKASLIGLDVKTLCSEYERMTGQKLNHRQIATIVNIQNLGRNILYRTKSK